MLIAAYSAKVVSATKAGQWLGNGSSYWI